MIILKNGFDNKCEDIQDYIIKNGDADSVYKFAKFVKNVEGVNMENLENAIIKKQNTQYLYYFSTTIKVANIEKIEDSLINTKNKKIFIYF